MATEFSEELQRLFISFLLSDKELFVRCRNIVNPAYFLINLRPKKRYLDKKVSRLFSHFLDLLFYLSII